MWHLKTRLGEFWILPSSGGRKYFLGVKDDELGEYKNPEQAAQAVFHQETGYLEWDSQSKISVPQHINQWQEGIPKVWNKLQ